MYIEKINGPEDVKKIEYQNFQSLQRKCAMRF